MRHWRNSAAMDEPTYSPNTRTVDLLALLKSEVSAVTAREAGAREPALI